MALQHLHDLGHRHIAFIAGPKILVDSGDRWNGVLTYAQEVGLAIDPDLVVEVKESTSSYQSGFELAQELLHRRRKFTAVLAFDDVTAFGVIRALDNASRRVPEDCSVIGFDDISMAGCYNSPLTTIRQPMSDLGSIGVKLLLKRIQASLSKTRLPPEYVKVEPELIVRDSTARR